MAESVIKGNPVNIGSEQNVSQYDSPSNLFTCPSDGYIKLIADVDVGNTTVAKTPSGTSFAVARCFIRNISSQLVIYVRAGMKFYFTRTESTYSVARFIPIS